MTQTYEPLPSQPWLPTGKIKMTSLDLPLIAINETLHPSIRGLALHLTTDASQYCNIGFFFRSLTDSDIDELLEMHNANPFNNELVLLALLLGRAEGATDIQPDYVRDATPMLGTLLKVEHYARMHGSELHRMNYSLTTCDRIIVNSDTALEMQEYFNNLE